MAQACLEFEQLEVIYPRSRGGQAFAALQSIDLTLHQGECLGLVGESGCGKSTLAKVAMQIVRPSCGEFRLLGQNPYTLPPRQRRLLGLEIQMVFQDPYSSLNPRLSIAGTLQEALLARHAKLTAQDLQTKLRELCSDCGIAAAHLQRYPHQLSGGQRQRVAIARALAVQPQILIADEAVSALDVSYQAQILNLLKDLQSQRQLSLLFISHDLDVVAYLCQKIAVLDQGRIVEIGSNSQIMQHPAHAYTRQLLAARYQPDCPTAQ